MKRFRFPYFSRSTVPQHRETLFRKVCDINSFTLVELLVVIGILAILTAATVIVLNPAELLKQSRDSKRTTDLANLNNGIKLLLTQNPDVNLGSASTVYISLSDSSSTCGSYSLPVLPAGWQYHCATAANLNKVDSTGWIPISFSSATSGVASLAALPLDPQNSGAYYYSYIPGGSWEIMGMFESEKYAAKARSDAGTDPERLEVGSNLALWKDVYGLIGYWPMDEGSGTAVVDRSGNNNTGTLSGASWESGANCKVGGCLIFDGVNDYVSIGSANISPSYITVSAWINVKSLISQSSEKWIMAIPIDASPWESYGFIWHPSGSGYTLAFDTYESWVESLSTVLDFDTFHHFVGTYSGATLNVYIDGVLVKSVNKSGTPLTYIGNKPFMIGSRSGPSYNTNVVADDVRVYNRALSAAEIQAIYNATK